MILCLQKKYVLTDVTNPKNAETSKTNFRKVLDNILYATTLLILNIVLEKMRKYFTKGGRGLGGRDVGGHRVCYNTARFITPCCFTVYTHTRKRYNIWILLRWSYPQIKYLEYLIYGATPPPHTSQKVFLCGISKSF